MTCQSCTLRESLLIVALPLSGYLDVETPVARFAHIFVLYILSAHVLEVAVRFSAAITDKIVVVVHAVLRMVRPGVSIHDLNLHKFSSDYNFRDAV